jgi:hypothetical protein
MLPKDRTSRVGPLPMIGRVRLVGLAFLVILSALGMQVPARAAEAPHFDPSATQATLAGDTVTVTFLELGLSPGATAKIEVVATATSTTQCASGDDPSSTILAGPSHASATTINSYMARPDGTISATVSLVASPGTATISLPGWTCSTTRSLEIQLTDLTNDSTYRFVPGV